MLKDCNFPFLYTNYSCINPHKFKNLLTNKPKRAKIKYKMTKFGSEKGTYHTEFGNTHSSWLGNSNLSTNVKSSEDSFYERMAQGIPSRNNRAFSITSKPQLSSSLRRSLLKKGDIRNRNQSLLEQWSSGGGSIGPVSRVSTAIHSKRRSI